VEYYYKLGVNEDLIVVLEFLQRSSTDMRVCPLDTADFLETKEYKRFSDDGYHCPQPLFPVIRDNVT
jgi:hypothetical protein